MHIYNNINLLEVFVYIVRYRPIFGRTESGKQAYDSSFLFCIFYVYTLFVNMYLLFSNGLGEGWDRNGGGHFA